MSFDAWLKNKDYFSHKIEVYLEYMKSLKLYIFRLFPQQIHHELEVFRLGDVAVHHSEVEAVEQKLS